MSDLINLILGIGEFLLSWRLILCSVIGLGLGALLYIDPRPDTADQLYAFVIGAIGIIVGFAWEIKAASK